MPSGCGTRGLLLSNTVRVHRKLRQAGVESVPESKEAFEEIARFFDKHLGK